MCDGVLSLEAARTQQEGSRERCIQHIQNSQLQELEEQVLFKIRIFIKELPGNFRMLLASAVQ